MPSENPEYLAATRRRLELLTELRRRLSQNALDTYAPYAKQREFHRAVRTHRETMLVAGNQCISPWTFVSTDQGEVPAAAAWRGVDGSAQALDDGRIQNVRWRNAMLRGIAPMYRLVLDTGRFLDCTDEHLLWSDGCYIPMNALLSHSSGQCYWHRVEDFQANCVVDGYLDDPESLPAPGIFRDALPSRCGALERSLVFSPEDAAARIPAHIRSSLRTDLLTIAGDDEILISDLYAQFAGPMQNSDVLRLRGDTPASRPLLSGYGQHPVVIEDLPELGHVEQLARYSDGVVGVYYPSEQVPLWQGINIQAIVPLGYQPVLDVQVPKANNYLAGGVVNHNCGKTLAACAEIAIHASGRYPSWWDGRVIPRGNIWWVASETMEVSRDAVQRLLLGRPGEIGTGWLPGDAILDVKSYPNVADATSVVTVKHAHSGTSRIVFKSYDQGRKRFQGETLTGGILFDEEPPIDIYTEGLTRTNATGAPVMLTFTPLLGMSDVVRRFWMDDADPTRIYVQMGIADAEHYTPEERQQIINSYPAHERDARAFGIPQLGDGAIFPISDDDIVVEPFPIPETWPSIGGLDFGWDHPFAGIRLVNQPDFDAWYVVQETRMRKTLMSEIAMNLMGWGKWLPWAWPHDGLKTDPRSGTTIAQLYADFGLNMIPDHATHPSGGFGVEAGIMDMLNLMQVGRFKVFSNCGCWLQEKNTYHRKDGKIVKEHDDTLDASRIAMMMRRFAVVKPQRLRTVMHTPSAPTLIDGMAY